MLSKKVGELSDSFDNYDKKMKELDEKERNIPNFDTSVFEINQIITQLGDKNG